MAHGIGITKGGRNTKLHAVCDEKGHPHALLLTPGNTHDAKVAVLAGEQGFFAYLQIALTDEAALGYLLRSFKVGLCSLDEVLLDSDLRLDLANLRAQTCLLSGELALLC